MTEFADLLRVMIAHRKFAQVRRKIGSLDFDTAALTAIDRESNERENPAQLYLEMGGIFDDALRSGDPEEIAATCLSLPRKVQSAFGPNIISVNLPFALPATKTNRYAAASF